MVEKLSTPAGRAAYAERKWLSEAPYGWIKHVLGFGASACVGWRRCGASGTSCLAANAKRLHDRDGSGPH